MVNQELRRDRPLVLVVDDDMVLRPMVCEILRQSGFAVEEAENGALALAAFMRVQPDIVLLDVMMPELDGFTTCAALRKLPGGEQTPVLMVTGRNDNESIKRAYEVGATDFIAKPLNWEILTQRVRYMLRAGKALQEVREREAENCALLTEARKTAQELAIAKEAAEAADRAKSEFLATISHELRTPLHVVLGYIDLLGEGDFGPVTAAQEGVLRRVKRQTVGLVDLISAILDLSRLEAGRLPVEMKNVHLAELLQEVEAETQEIRKQARVEWVWSVAEGLPSVYTDPGKLKIVIKNLIDNAAKFTEHGRITVAAYRHQDGVEIAVKDTGIGIPPEELSLIFEPFRQVANTMILAVSGTGLGLHIVKRLLGMLGGTITVESQVGHGSTFRVWVPVHQTSVGETAAASAVSMNSG
jgi:signal transduction histidine kinase